MKVLIGCERSGVVRDAFRALGHDAWSCDILDAETPSPYHIKDDVMNHLNDGWDLAGFHPNCQNLCVSGARYFKDKKDLQERDLDFVANLMSANIPRIYLENPVGIISTRIRKPDQIIQPYEFGHEETKKTCLWLKNLPLLKPTKIMEIRNKNLTPSGQNKLGPSKDRAYLRARTYLGIAKAMAEQWGILSPNPEIQTVLIKHPLVNEMESKS